MLDRSLRNLKIALVHFLFRVVQTLKLHLLKEFVVEYQIGKARSQKKSALWFAKMHLGSFIAMLNSLILLNTVSMLCKCSSIAKAVFSSSASSSGMDQKAYAASNDVQYYEHCISSKTSWI